MSGLRSLLRTRLGRLFAAIVAALALATTVALIVLWPGEEAKAPLSQGLAAPSERAQVERIVAYPCSGYQTDECRRVDIRLLSGVDQGDPTTLELGAGGLDPELEVGDELRVVANAGPATENAPGYSLSDFERRSPMLFLALAFVLLVLVFARLRGLLSLVGLALSLALVLLFVVPSILAGQAPLAVAVVGAFAVMLITIPLAHGLGPKSIAAVLGTGASLVLTVLLAVIFTDVAHLTGLSSEDATILQANESGVSLEGLVLAGMVIGALGVLDDVTVSQASTVMALRATNPAQPLRTLYAHALRVGRDHVSATVNTLVLAYVGASLPVLLIFSSGELGFLDAVNLEVVAKEVIATLVGSIGLIAAVPITTGLAAVLSAGMREPDLVAAGAHAH